MESRAPHKWVSGEGRGVSSPPEQGQMRTEREGLAGQGTRRHWMAWACPCPMGRPRFT